ncbi:MAG: hypothetical protein VXY15_05610 [Bacteroidota bacterium]|nr:hypothetical protein [Bacteroidota bacterium]
MKNKLIFLFAIISINVCCRYNNDKNNYQWIDFVEFREGNIPLIIIAPHGGDLKPQWIENRDCEGSVITKDLYTLDIAFQVENELKNNGFQPYIVYAKIHRVKLDLNRSLETSHCDDDTSNELWQLFHDQIFNYRQEIISRFNRGLLIDLHGHGHPIQRIELGYLLKGDMLREVSNNESFISYSETSISSLIANHPANKKLVDLLFGESSLGTLLSKNGFPAVPSSKDRAPRSGEQFFSGGTITKEYGSKYQNGVDAIQIEMNRNGLRQDSGDRERFSKVFAKILIDYMKIHYSDVFPSNLN